MCFGCSKEPPYWDGSFEYPQYMFWLRNKKKYFSSRHSYLESWRHSKSVQENIVWHIIGSRFVPGELRRKFYVTIIPGFKGLEKQKFNVCTIAIISLLAVAFVVCNQLGLRSGPTECPSWFRSTLCVRAGKALKRLRRYMYIGSPEPSLLA